ncbi:hypothetical protein DL95DRAFT_527109 [Leptodontidium sp. 2 PMI_412]|nr:hypothetical protein DL95DRAFT_527109 [Leptodontidium sp. 2 PMI_412]
MAASAFLGRGHHILTRTSDSPFKFPSQRHFCSPTPGNQDLETAQNRKRTGTVYNITWFVEPNSKKESIRPGIIAKKRDPEVMRMVQLTSEISFRLIKAADGAWTEEHERQWIKEASLTCGGGDSKSITSIQVNLTAIKKSDEVGEEPEASAYPVQTTPETDIQEYDTDTGSRFAPYATDLPLDSSIRFRPSTGIHFPKLPEDTPYTRCLTIAYSRQDCMRARTRQLNSSIFGDTGLGGFISRKAQSNWMIRHAIRDGLDIGVRDLSVEDYLEKFSWIEDGKKCFEDRKLVEDPLSLRGADNKEWELIMMKLLRLEDESESGRIMRRMMMTKTNMTSHPDRKWIMRRVGILSSAGAPENGTGKLEFWIIKQNYSSCPMMPKTSPARDSEP